MAGGRKALYQNWLSYIGAVIGGVSALLILATFLWAFGLRKPSPYIGIFTYLVFPVAFLTGLVLFLYGMRRESVRRRRLRTDEALPYPRLDLNDRRQRRLFGWLVIGGSLLAILFGFLGYNGFVFTESVTFCGKVCHEVMEPEYKAYIAGPHARVPCVECHVGSGVPWYVKSKMTGLYQVYAVLADVYPRPIPVPIKNLRPARETCEECHWPQKFYGAKLIQKPHFRYDEQNTAEQISVILKTGGGDPRLGQRAGTHWHMTVENEIEFRASDRELQQIVWIRAKRMDGTVTEYRDRSTPLSAEQIERLPVRKMDCMDCHNRPAHVFLSPEQEVDLALASGRISPKLPWIKKVAVDALVQEYPDNEVAFQRIRESISTFYKQRYPEVAEQDAAGIEEATDAITAIYERNVFPKMRVDFRTYASNVGHRTWPGCFRCHDGEHVSEAGQVVRTECTTCHTLPQRGPLTPLGALPPAGEKEWHPLPLTGKHQKVLCNRCHGSFRPPSDCAECHKLDQKAPMMAGGCEQCHQVVGDVQPLVACADCHDDLPGLHQKHSSPSCITCHRPHKFRMEGREGCLSCHADRKEHYPPDPCAKCHEFR